LGGFELVITSTSMRVVSPYRDQWTGPRESERDCVWWRMRWRVSFYQLRTARKATPSMPINAGPWI